MLIGVNERGLQLFIVKLCSIHQAAKKASSICSLNSQTIQFLYHDSGCSEREALFGGNGKLQRFVACHTMLAFTSIDFYSNCVKPIMRKQELEILLRMRKK